MKTNYYRDRDGQKATSVIDLGCAQELEISTRRWSDGSLITSASVHRINGASRVHVIGFNGDGDYTKRLVLSRPSRVTAAVVKSQHDQCLTRLPALLQEVEQHYLALQDKQKKEASHAG